jgi:RimJ/RimL family protein N-acetyltransferase
MLTAPPSSPRRLVLPAGEAVLVRPLETSDRAAFAAAVARLSPETLYRRFGTPKPALTETEIDQLVAVDHHRHEALVALHPDTGEGLGVARFVRFADDPSRADVAVTVVDRWQGRGVAGRLLELLVERARAEGLRVLTASTLRENHPARRLLRRRGFRAVAAGHGVVELELPLAAGYPGWESNPHARSSSGF